MRQPNHITSFEMHNLIDCETEFNGRWVPARPLALSEPFWRRFYLAFMVLVGKYDALEFPGQ